MNIPSIFWIVPAASVVALAFAWAFYRLMKREDEGTPRMREIAAHVRKGAMAYLRQQYKVVGIVFAVLALFFAYLAYGAGVQNGWVPFAFITGGFFSGLAGYFGMKTATYASARTANAARQSLDRGLKVAFRSGAVMGLVVVGLGLLDISFWYVILNRFVEVAGPQKLVVITTTMLTFGMGASTQALFARVGGGIYTKAADVGADLVGKVEAGIPEDDPRNPATIADNVGDNVGDVAGMGADLFESYTGSILAPTILAATFGALGDYFRTQPGLPLLLVFLAGFGMKAGLFPMHVWLPEAHPAAPSHVSALMSGVMIKTGVYGILRVTAALGEQPLLHTAGVILLASGVVTGLWGVILAAVQNDVKRLLAYSSIENVGVILIGLGVAALGKSSGNQLVALCGVTGALLHTLNHSLFKSLLFFGAGNILSQTRSTSLDALGGLAKHMPLTAILFLTGTAAICALPPLNGFVSELLIYLGMLDGIASGSNTLASAAGLAALALIGGLVVLAFTKLYGTVFLGSPRTHEVAESSEADAFRIAAMALPLAGILFVGLFPRAAVSAVTRAAGFFLRPPADAADWLLSPPLAAAGRTAWLLIAVVALLLWLRRRTLRTRTVAKGPTWGCGFTAPNVRMQYTGEFSEGLQSIATSLTQNSGQGSPVGKGEIFPAAHSFDIGHRDRIGRLFAAWWVELLRVINQRVMRLRTGKINHYILFALAFLGLVFLLSVFNVI